MAASTSLASLTSQFFARYNDAVASGEVTAVREVLETADATANTVVPPTVGAYSFVEVLPPDPRAVAQRQAQQRPVVRRPTLGLVGYENRFATIEVIVRGGDSGAGESIELFNSSYRSGRNPINTNFIVQQVDVRQEEAAQLVRTFGDYYLNDVGENPEVLQVQGVLFEARNFPWLTEWQRNYRKYLRARQCIMRKAMVYLTIDDTMYVGYMLSTGNVRSTNVAWELVPFNFSMVLRNTVDLRAVALFPDQPSTEAPETPDRSRPPQVAALQETLSLEAAATRGPLTATETAYGETATGIFLNPEGGNDIFLGEIVAGAFEGQRESLTTPVLKYAGAKSEAAFRVNVEEQVAVARSINAAMGREVFNLQGVRNGYMAGRQADFAGMGITDPEVLARYGFPSRYQNELDARRQRVQEEYRATLEDALTSARDAITSYDWF